MILTGSRKNSKTKYDVVLAVAGKFPNSTGPMLELLKAEAPPLDWDDYCALTATEQLVWKERGDASTKAMLLLMNSKNDNTKKNLRLSYSQGNKSAYPVTPEATVRFLST